MESPERAHVSLTERRSGRPKSSRREGRKLTVTIDYLLYHALRDLVAMRRYPSISFCVEDLLRIALRSEAMVPYKKEVE